MNRLKVILKYVGDVLLFVVLTTIFLAIVSAFTLGAILLLDNIGKWIGIGEDIFIYVVWFVIFWKAWDFLSWIVGKIADREERKKEREYFERLNNNKQ